MESEKLDRTAKEQLEAYNALIEKNGGETEEIRAVVERGKLLAEEVGEDDDDNQITDWDT